MSLLLTSALIINISGLSEILAFFKIFHLLPKPYCRLRQTLIMNLTIPSVSPNPQIVFPSI